ncbi:AAA family ATPase [Providencia vermicola]|uniref:AAA family ATPase n=1 Tax=Providencia vermicola TaxID=333965 RepID=UPI0032DB1E0D
MHLESLKIVNYRKFRTEENVIHFVEPCEIKESSKESMEYNGIGPSTTLIIGKNNVGKTTIVNALKMVCENTQPKAADFNVQYLQDLFEEYLTGKEIKKYPELEFKIIVNVDFEKNDLVSVLDEFMPIKDTASESDSSNKKKIEITVKVEIVEQAVFSNAINDIFKDLLPRKFKNSKDQEYKEKIIMKLTHFFYELLDQNSDYLNLGENKKLFEIKYYNKNNRQVSKFSLKKLINLKEIKANRHLKEDVLSNIFNKIISFQFENDSVRKSKIKNDINEINKGITKNVEEKGDDVSSILKKIENRKHVGLKLFGNVTYDGLIKNLIKYNFSDDGDFIPESQFGLGYINLLNIIGEIIHYVDSYENGSQNSCINLLFIEEPEVFMHPQMQEFFIKRIDDAVKEVLSLTNKKNKKVLNCQITITTHSSHIVNSKIHSSNSFNNINYVTVLDKSARVINLNDHAISKGIADEIENQSEGKKGKKGKEKNEIDELKFIKKHIKYKVSELFFSDAVIFVEGATEETLLQYYLEKNTELSQFYISVFNINGAHGKVYFSLAKTLRIPCLIITDLDIKREICQKNKKHSKSDENCNICGHIEGVDDSNIISSKVGYNQISDLTSYFSTNETIRYFQQRINKDKELPSLVSLKNINYFENENIFVVFQKNKVSGYYATSLEEAFILLNFENEILNNALEKCKPRVYKEIVGSPVDKNKLKENSFKIQNKLSDSKNNFSSELLYGCIVSDEKNIPNLPQYIIDGFKWLNKELNGTKIQEEA